MKKAVYAFFIVLLCLSPIQLRGFQFVAYEENGAFGVKDTSNTIIITARYQKVGWSNADFQIIDQTIGAQTNDRWALLDLKGSNITPHRFASITPTPLNTFIVSERRRASIRTQYGIINSRGKEILPLNFIHLKAVNENALMVRTEREGSFFSGLIDYKGKVLIDINYKSIALLSKNRLVVENQEGLKAIFSTTGKALTAFQYTRIFSFNENLIFIERYNHMGLLDSKAQMIVPPLYKEIRIEGGHILVMPFAQWGYFEKNKSRGVFYEDDVFFASKNQLWFNAGSRSSLFDPTTGKITPLRGLHITNANEKMALVQKAEGKTYQVINNELKLIRPDVYDSVVLAQEVFFGLKRNDSQMEWLAYDTLGKAQSLFTYSEFRHLPNRMYMAQRMKKYGLLNANGKDISPFIYDSIQPFNEDVAIAQYQGRFGLIDQRGNWRVTPYQDSLSVFQDKFYFEQGSFKGIIDRYGKISIRESEPFTLLPHGFYRKKEAGYQLFNQNGSLALDHHYDTIQSIQEDVVYLKRDQTSFLYHISDSSSYALGSKISAVRPVDKGWIPIKKDGQWGLINKNGQLKIANRYQDIRPFSEERAPIKLIGKWGFIDTNENLVIQPNYDVVTDFREHQSIVQQGKFFGLINREGEVILPVQFSSIQRLENGYIVIEKDGKLGLTDVEGKMIKNPQYDQLKFISDTHLLVDLGGRLGIIDVNGADIVPIIYEAIKYSGDRFLGKISATWEAFK